MTPDNRTATLAARSADYHGIMRTTIFTFLGIAAVIEFAGGGYSAPLATLVVANAAYGILAGGAALDDLHGLRQSMDDATAQTAYGKVVASRNIPTLKMVSSVLLGLIGLAELYAILL